MPSSLPIPRPSAMSGAVDGCVSGSTGSLRRCSPIFSLTRGAWSRRENSRRHMWHPASRHSEARYDSLAAETIRVRWITGSDMDLSEDDLTPEQRRMVEAVHAEYTQQLLRVNVDLRTASPLMHEVVPPE